MKKIAWFLLLLMVSFPLLGQAPDIKPDIKWNNQTEYAHYMTVFNEKDLVTKAAGAEKFLTDHKNADPMARTNAYVMMFLSYANTSNWTKTVETFDRIHLAPQLTDQQKTQFAQIASLARQRLGK